MKLRVLAVVAVGFLLPFAAGCSSDSTGDLKKGDLSKELVKAGMGKKQADCMATALIKADFTKDELDKMNKGSNGGVDKAKVTAFTSAATKCVTGGLTPAG